MTHDANVNWQYPAPRTGFMGEMDKFLGPGTTRAEFWLEIGAAVAAAVALVLYALAKPLDWSVWQFLVAALLTLDIVGGVVTNAASSAKRWYHRPQQGLRQHMTFIAVHALQLVLMVLFFRANDWGYFVIAYGYLLLSSLVILRLPLYLQRPAAMLALCGGFVLNSYVLIPAAGLEWFLPVFYLKLLVCHLLREEPYRPTGES
ncbi:MAG: hypothetical protein U0694_09500 [Anaerolineae bacterium]